MNVINTQLIEVLFLYCKQDLCKYIYPDDMNVFLSYYYYCIRYIVNVCILCINLIFRRLNHYYYHYYYYLQTIHINNYFEFIQ